MKISDRIQLLKESIWRVDRRLSMRSISNSSAQVTRIAAYEESLLCLDSNNILMRFGTDGSVSKLNRAREQVFFVGTCYQSLYIICKLRHEPDIRVFKVIGADLDGRKRMLDQYALGNISGVIGLDLKLGRLVIRKSNLCVEVYSFIKNEIEASISTEEGA
jgi:hypothetical protein